MLRKKSLYALLALSTMACGPVVAAEAVSEKQTEQAQASEIDIKKLSQAFGHFIGKNLKSSGLNFDIESLVSGIKDGAEGKPSPLTEQEYEKGMLALQERALKKISDENLKAADAFLKDNAGKPNIVVVEPGKLQYQIVTAGTGKVVGEHSSPTINYKGQYIDGTVFGSSEDAGGPITLPLDQTIPGFAKGIVGMKEGEKRKLFVHPDLGYGTSGQLPPNSLLIFEIEVIKATDDKSSSNEDDEILPLAENEPNDKASKKDAKSDSSDDSDDEDYDDDDDSDDDNDDDDDDDDDDDSDKKKEPAKTPAPSNAKPVSKADKK